VDIQVLASSSKGNCYRVSDGHTPLLLECGIPYKEIQRGINFKIAEIAGCLITHEHKDHCKSIKEIMKAGIDCYLSQGTATALGAIGHRLKIVKSKQQFNIGTWTVLPFDIQHDCAEPLGFLLADSTGEKLLYATDTYYIKYKFNGLTHILIECNHSYKIINENVEAGFLSWSMKQRLIQSHFSLENVKKFLLANDLSKVQGIWLIHLSRANSNAELFKREVQEITGKPVYIAG
jgi:phosphoribosyl 1,2-cyclic phosphodiesterase